MTTPQPLTADSPQAPKVSFLGRIFGKVQKAPSAPAGLEDFAHYTVEPGSHGTDASRWYLQDSPDIDDQYFNTIYQQDELLTHWDRPPADENPTAWWQDRTQWFQAQRNSIENQMGVPWTLDQSMPGEPGPNPRWSPPVVERPTAFNSPRGYTFTRPFDQDSEHQLNGVHMSLADLKTAYLLAGESGTSINWYNTYRLDPMSNDASYTFVGDTVTPDTATKIVYSTENDVPHLPSYRLM